MARTTKRFQVGEIMTFRVAVRDDVMDLYSVVTAARNADIPITNKRVMPALFPDTNIRSHLAATPEDALFCAMYSRISLNSTCTAAARPFLRLFFSEFFPANNACSMLRMCISPSGREVARLRAVLRVMSDDSRMTNVKPGSAVDANASFASSLPAGNSTSALVPRYESFLKHPRILPLKEAYFKQAVAHIDAKDRQKVMQF
jgi:hypothetical protein